MSETLARHINEKAVSSHWNLLFSIPTGRDKTAPGYSWCLPSCFGSRLLKVWSLELVINAGLGPRFRLPESETQGRPEPAETQGRPEPAALGCPLGRLPAAS